ncbi:MAG: glycosyltransferase [Patescibacteria group bacterium]|jgi:glycosyltransferase involved in cell wall biosynthesis
MSKILINDIGFIHGNNRVPILERIHYWQENGHAVSILCPPNAKSFYEQSTRDVLFITIPLTHEARNKITLIFEYLKRNVVCLTFLPKLVKGSDIVFSMSALLDFLILPYVMKLINKRIRWFVVFDNVVRLDVGLKGLIRVLAFIFFRFSLLFLRRADKVFVVTNSLRQKLVSLGIEEKQMVVTGNGLETELISRSKAFSNVSYDAIYVGRINKAKGVFDMLRVVDLVRDRYPKFLLALIGTGDRETLEELNKDILGKKLEKNVISLGSVFGVDKFSHIKSSKLFLFLSYDESYGVALMEAVCSGLFCVTYDVDVYDELYKNNEIITVPKGDISKAAGKVVEILSSKEFINHRGLERQTLSWVDIAKIESGFFDA